MVPCSSRRSTFWLVQLQSVGFILSRQKDEKLKIGLDKLSSVNASDVNRADGTFIVNSVLDVEKALLENVFRYVKVRPYEKRYPDDYFDVNEYMSSEHKDIYICYMDDGVAGQLVMRKNWNNYAYVEDIRVDRDFRRLGIGRKLLEKAVDWANGKGLAGVMLETQNNNAGACELYRKCGFKLGGVDRLLYKGLNPETSEIALYWYYLL